ncbi:MAG: metallophosphoesterase [Deltaproteobacteria bacterium]|nr:metallophosphoesterase [Deltaproteobacteria bacterium]
MLLFALTFLGVYTAMHALVFWGFHPLLKGHPALPTLTWIWMGLMILSPVLVRLLDRNGWETAARGLAWIGYSWMGLLFLAFAVFALLGCWEIVVFIARKLVPSLPSLSLHGAVSALIVLFGVLGTVFYGFQEASDIRVEKVRLTSAKLPSDFGVLKIVQVSDLHLGLIHREETLAPIISRIRELKPDLVVATGDIVDAQIDHLKELSILWQNLNPPLGKFAVTGNHEYYAGLKQALDFLQKSGFEVLRNRAQAVDQYFVVAGVDDPARGNRVDEVAVLNPIEKGRYVIFLKHRPRLNEKAAGLFDLQLSGHAHRGQIFPFNFLTGLEYPMQNGLYPLPGGSYLYASRGTGTWGPPIRVGSPPEITLFEIVPQ